MSPAVDKIRLAHGSDVEVLARFNSALARETEGKSLHLATVCEGVQTLLQNSEHGFYLIAERDQQVVGCLMVTSEWSDWRNGVFWWIQSVYVLPDFRRRGVFRVLYEEVERRARATETVCGLRLYVEQDNSNAQRTYESMGMQATPYRVYEIEFGSDHCDS